MRRALKIGSVFVAMAMLISGLTLLTPTTALDVGSPLEAITVDGDATVNDVMWSPDGTWGIAVGTHTGNGAVWQLNGSLNNADWTNPSVTVANTVWNKTAYSPTLNSGEGGFYVVGQDNGGGSNIRTFFRGGTVLPVVSSPVDAEKLITSVAVEPTGGILVAGHDSIADTAIGYYHSEPVDGAGWVGPLVFANDSALSNSTIYDVAFTGDEFLLVGQNTTEGFGFVYSANLSALRLGTANVVESRITVPGGVLNSISWITGNTNQYALVVGSPSIVYRVNTTGNLIDQLNPRFLNDEVYNLLRVRFDASSADDLEALIVGTNSSANAVILRYVHTGSSMGIVHVTGSPLAGGSLNCVAFKTYSSPRYGLALGAGIGYRINNVESFHDVDVYTIYPHIDEMNLYTGYVDNLDRGTVVMNSSVDVDTTLTLFLLARNDRGWNELNVVRIDIYMWWDNGLVGAASRNYRSTQLNGQAANNNHTHFVYTLANDTFWVSNPGGGEIDLVGGAIQSVDANNSTLQFHFHLGKQVWASTASLTTPGNKSFEDQLSADKGLLTGNTWDIEARIEGALGESESRFDEFGVYKYAELVAGNLPGKFIGSGPPGSAIVLEPLGGKNYTTYSVNYEYSLGVYVPDLFYNQDFTRSINVIGGNSLPGDDGLGVLGGDIAAYDFFDTLGSTGKKLFHNAVSQQLTGNTTQTQDISFVCNVRVGIDEDHYRGNLVYLIELS